MAGALWAAVPSGGAQGQLHGDWADDHARRTVLLAQSQGAASGYQPAFFLVRSVLIRPQKQSGERLDLSLGLPGAQ